ncbi:MAG: glycine cleavage system protein GcvH [Armatimonadota bacterium]|nr:glycine cleavage system protein GcvH [Armatimonadota bacterium]MDR7412633.1 glycine cleavage system protein GcvH [Armatimonadota bacterium]MDR7428837.1 glycine cleavage system protein GcvH [Armatimonadota bacterium]MDR7514525.1 glycine cleavage system protein GcvH [Armatimonadota bacterium]MDR7542294.1 glycine cleavage system protein GcvH [Armatimonadota bacterium]
MYPEDYRYSTEHEWAKRENGRVRVGITRFAADRLTDVVYVELPQVGSEVRFMQPFGVVESVKAASELYAPVSGRVVEVNERLRDRPELVNEDPHGEGWMIVVEATDPSELDRLMDAQAYRQHIGEA